MSRLSDQFDYMDLDDFEELLADKPRNEKWELIGGRVVKMMVGARWEHHRIIQNLSLRLGMQLLAKGSTCRIFTETFYMKEKSLDSALLPDVIVQCGRLEPGATSLNDPTVLIEVMSVGSIGRDRVEKWHIYRHLPSLMHYVLVDRDRALVEVFDRSGEAWFKHRVLEGLEAVLELPAIDAAVPLSHVYADVLIG